MSPVRYTLQAMALHWAQAILVIWLLWLGWTMVDLPKGAERSAAYSLHKSLGLLVLVLTVLRLGWRLPMHRRRRWPVAGRRGLPVACITRSISFCC